MKVIFFMMFIFFLNFSSYANALLVPSPFRSSIWDNIPAIIFKSSIQEERGSSSSVAMNNKRLQLETANEEGKNNYDGSFLSQILDDLIFQENDMMPVEKINDQIYNADELDPERSSRAQRLKLKSKRYNMLKDVSDLIDARDQKAIEKAMSTTKRFIEWNEEALDEDVDYKPIIQAFNLWLQAISKTSTSEKKGEEAEAVLSEMKKHCAPTVISYTIAITAYSDFPQHAERLFFELLERQQSVDPSLVITSSITTDAVLHSWAKQGTEKSAERAHMILERLEQWKATAVDGVQNNVETTSHTYSIVMHAYSKIGNVQQVEAMLAKRIAEDGKLGESMVDTILYNVAIKAWAVSKNPRAGSRATALLNQMKKTGIKADIITYNSVLSAWSKSSGHINAAVEAEKILQELIVTSKSNPDAPQPNTISYNTVLHAWSQSPQDIAVQRASNMLEYMIRSQDPPPDIYSFTSVLNVLAKSKVDPDKAVKARMLLDKLLQLSERKKELKPSVIAFNIVLNACAFSGGSFDETVKKRALQIAVSTFSQLRSGAVRTCAPDDATYGNMLKVISNLIPRQSHQRGKLGMTIMRQCMEDGLVGDMVWKELPNCISKKAIESLLPKPLIEIIRSGGSIELVDLPRNWRRNVKTKARRKQAFRKNKTRNDETSKPTARSVVKVPRGITEASWTGKEL